MNSIKGLCHFSCGSLRGAGGCGFAHAGASCRPSSMHGGNTAYIPIAIGRPVWVNCDAGTGWASSCEKPSNIFLERSEKQTMQELNDRLATYLERVRSLEEANTQLEGCIREWHDKRTRGNQFDFKEYEQNIVDMHDQIENGRVTNAGIVLQIDNAKMATEDFRIKYETEKALRQNVQNDVENIRKELDNMTIIITDLEMEIEALREDHILKKKKHEEDMAVHSSSDEPKVDVKVKTEPPEDLAKILAGIRQDYEAIIEKNSKSLEVWFQRQFANESTEASPNQEELQNARKEITELNRTLQTLEIDLQTQINTKYALENSLHETRSRYSFQLQSIQHLISKCEEELRELRHDIKRQNNQYKVLLGIKTRLEKEISTYRQLLEGRIDGMTGSESSGKEHEGSTSQKLKKIVRDSVDGHVVATHTAEIKRQV
ncbi:PREDICTED: keratin, type I cytoskeletal 23-like isoform X1 [Gekko japonicus]|uniref:Keratin, type I cytoskeletal 23-like isoform X1 n=1 Tax=Gekko japonicus TaxID=146911 RepID=A0ABM1JNS3_GEKJA|nr:PREDICTED: keratin, type I cytoskeletal 23-like isoform X1 [Gekko japonicus]